MTTKLDSELLAEARKRISKRRHWTQNSMARNRSGKTVPVGSPNARSFCALGALFRELPEQDFVPTVDRLMGLLDEIAKSLTTTSQGPGRAVAFSLMILNDTWSDDPALTHKAVLLVYDQAIREAKDQETRGRS